MDLDTSIPVLSEELEKVLHAGRECTQPGAPIANCLYLFGSTEGGCNICTRPCLHPLATADLQSFFHVALFLHFQ